MPAVISIQPGLPVELCSPSVEVCSPSVELCLWGGCLWGGVCGGGCLCQLTTPHPGAHSPPISQPDPGRGMDRQTETHWASSARPRPPWGGVLPLQPHTLGPSSGPLPSASPGRDLAGFVSAAFSSGPFPGCENAKVLADGAAFVIGREPADISAVFHVADHFALIRSFVMPVPSDTNSLHFTWFSKTKATHTGLAFRSGEPRRHEPAQSNISNLWEVPSVSSGTSTVPTCSVRNTGWFQRPPVQLRAPGELGSAR
ncbi:unnamed protein product [Arctogadus glacialis]